MSTRKGASIHPFFNSEEALLALLPSISTDVTVNHCAWVTIEGRTIDCYLITGCDGGDGMFFSKF